VHRELEESLADHLGTESTLVFSSGYLANLGTVAALSGNGDLIVSDATNHASLIDACRLSRARIEVAPHRDADAFGKILVERREANALAVTDSVFSVDGERAPLMRLATVARHADALLIIDEAHGLGVIGQRGEGAVREAGLAGAADIIVTATLSKSLASQGGVVAASSAVIDHIINSARPFIFDTGLAPASAAAALAALRHLQANPDLAELSRVNARRIAEIAQQSGLTVSRPDAAVCSVLIGDPTKAVAARELCLSLGVRVGCFRPPSVSDGVSRIRLTARANLSKTDFALIERALRSVATEIAGAHP
jgi:8-amino-7-oxononanoate synthase